MSDVFISYSRKDNQFVRRIHDALAKRNRDVWVDWEDIPLTANWWNEISEGIEQADTFLFVMSPNSVASPICNFEVAHALHHNKRIVPIVLQEVNETEAFASLAALKLNEGAQEILGDRDLLSVARSSWAGLARHNWIVFADDSKFDETFDKLLTILDTDLDHVKVHTRLLTQAIEWEDSGRHRSYLLAGIQIDEMESWQSTNIDKEPRPTQLQSEYILASRTQHRKQGRRLFTVATIALLVSFSLAVLSGIQSIQATNSAATATFAQGEALNQASTAVSAQQLAEQQSTEAYDNLIQSQNIQALFLADLAQQQIELNNYQKALGLALESANFRDDGYINHESREAIFDSLAQLQYQETYFYHEGDVLQASWNADETQIITVSSDDTIRLWDVETGAIIREFRHEGLNGNIWSEDQTRLVTWSRNGTLHIWDVTTGEFIFSVSYQGDNQTSTSIIHASLNNTESEILIWSDDGKIQVWDINENRALYTLQHKFVAPRTRIINQMSSWNSSDTKIVTWSDDGNIYVWNANNGEILQHIYEEGAEGALWNSTGTRLVTWSSNNASVWDMNNQEILFTAQHDHWIRGVKWNRDGTKLMTRGQDGYVHIWDGTSGANLLTVQPQALVWGASWNSGETEIVTWNSNGVVQIWDVATGNLVFSGQHDDDVNGAMWNSDETKLLTWSDDRSLRVWDVVNDQLIFTAYHGQDDERPYFLFDIGATWNHDSTRILSWAKDNTARIWNTNSHDVLTTVQHKAAVWGVSWNLDYTQLLTWSMDGTARITDIASGNTVFTLNRQEHIVYASLNSDESKLLTWTPSGVIQIVDIAKDLVTFQTTQERLIGATWNSEGTKLLAWSADGLIQVWNIEQNKLDFSVKHGDISIETGYSPFDVAAAWNDDETRILVWSIDGIVQIWDSVNETVVFKISHEDAVMRATWNDDETQLLTWSADGTIHTWDLTSGRLLFTAELEPEQAIYGVSWSEDETKLIAWIVGFDLRVLMWDVDTSNLLFDELVAEESSGPAHLTWNIGELQTLFTSLGGRSTVWYDDLSWGWDLQAEFYREINNYKYNDNDSNIIVPAQDGIMIYDSVRGDNLFEIKHDQLLSFTRNQSNTRLLTWGQDAAHVWLIDFDRLFEIAEEKVIPELLTNTDRQNFFMPTLEPTVTP